MDQLEAWLSFSLDAFGFGIVALGLQKATPFSVLETRIPFSFRELVWWCNVCESHRIVGGHLLTHDFTNIAGSFEVTQS